MPWGLKWDFLYYTEARFSKKTLSYNNVLLRVNGKQHKIYSALYKTVS